MEHPYLFLIKILESVGLGHFAHQYPHVIHTWFVMLILIVAGFFATRGIRLVPGKAQNFFEMVLDGLENFMVETSGEEGRFFFPIIATLFLYIFLANLLGLVPGFFSPTANLNSTLAPAIIVFFYTHYIGIKFHGIKYVKHFLGPVWWLAPIMLPIELVGHFARVMSLSFRLFGNIMGKELVLAMLFVLAGKFLAPLPIMVLGIFVSFIQAFIFTLLAIMYFTGAMEEAH